MKQFLNNKIFYKNKGLTTMKKGQIIEGIVEHVEFPNKGIIYFDNERVIVKNTIPGQTIKACINKKRKNRAEGRLLEIIKKSDLETNPNTCSHFGICGGCVYQSLPYAEQLKIKHTQVKNILDEVISDYEYEEILGSPIHHAYRNKMEFSFGDEFKDGPLALGMHKRNSFYDIVTVSNCQIVDTDYSMILNATLSYFSKQELNFYKKMQHTGYLRHLLVRKAVKTGEILINLITSTQSSPDLSEYVNLLKSLELNGQIVGILNTLNDSLADVVQNDKTIILYGQDYFYEELLGLKFKISPFSFFQTNSLGAEVLYNKTREYIGETKNKIIFDLYSGTGTIAQILAPIAKNVTGVEIVEEAVVAAKENSKLNGLTNCHFISGDVLKVIDELKDNKPDLIVIDPPRDGVHPKALEKICDFCTDKIIYISCKPTSLARDLIILLERGYKVDKVCAVDMFPGTVHVETVVLLSKLK